MENKEYLKETQGYIYETRLTWEDHPEKVFVHEYGNEYSAKKACDNWNKFPGAKCEYRKVML